VVLNQVDEREYIRDDELATYSIYLAAGALLKNVLLHHPIWN
jgi:hypothetical protein